MFHTTTVSIRDLRTAFPKVEAMLPAGEDVWISKRGKPFARITLDSPRPVSKPDFKARLGPSSAVRPIPTKSGA